MEHEIDQTVLAIIHSKEDVGGAFGIDIVSQQISPAIFTAAIQRLIEKGLVLEDKTDSLIRYRPAETR